MPKLLVNLYALVSSVFLTLINCLVSPSLANFNLLEGDINFTCKILDLVVALSITPLIK